MMGVCGGGHMMGVCGDGHMMGVCGDGHMMGVCGDGHMMGVCGDGHMMGFYVCVCVSLCVCTRVGWRGDWKFSTKDRSNPGLVPLHLISRMTGFSVQLECVCV